MMTHSGLRPGDLDRVASIACRMASKMCHAQDSALLRTLLYPGRLFATMAFPAGL
jgi:hypothetical protein